MSNAQHMMQPTTLVAQLSGEQLKVVDLSNAENYASQHVPGAQHLDYKRIIRVAKPAMGLVPEKTQLESVLSSIGVTPTQHVVAYDDEGGAKAARLLWTLASLGHENWSLLNGGMHTWRNEHFPMVSDRPPLAPSHYQASLSEDCTADEQYILDNLDNPKVVLLDARSLQEYQGVKKYARRGGHIPGAVHFDWINALNVAENLKIRPVDELKSKLASMGVVPEKEVIVYCQAHHRSSHVFVLLKHLGFPNVKGYPGSWSEWGNHTDTPIA